MAGRKKKISTDELLKITKEYARTQPFSPLIPSKLASYAQVLGYFNLIYKDFTRNADVMTYINEYNEELKIALDTASATESVYCTKDAHDFLRKNNTEEKLIRAIQWIDGILSRNAETITGLQTENDALKQQIITLRESLSLKTNEMIDIENKSSAYKKQAKELSKWIDINMNQITAINILNRRHEKIQPCEESLLQDPDVSAPSHLTHNSNKAHKKSAFSFKEIEKTIEDLPPENNTINQILKALEDLK